MNEYVIMMDGKFYQWDMTLGPGIDRWVESLNNPVDPPSIFDNLDSARRWRDRRAPKGVIVKTYRMVNTYQVW